MPQFIFVELPSFRIKDMAGHTVSLTRAQRALTLTLYQYIRSGLRTVDFTDLSASLLFAGGETDIWTSANIPGGLHAEESLLLNWHQSFDSPGAYPIVDAMLFSHKPCTSCLPYFQSNGKHCRPGNGIQPFRAKFTPRSDRHYTPIFYLARSLDPASRNSLWIQMAQMWASDFTDTMISSSDVEKGKLYYIMADSQWFAINEQEEMTDAEIAEAIARQGAFPTYWIGR